MATGSYEGSLSVEGTSGCHEPFPFTRRWSRRPWRLPHAEKRSRSQEPKLRRQREGAPTFRGRGRGDRGVRGSIALGAVDRERPRSRAPPSRKTAKHERQGSACPAAIRRSVTSAVKHSVPWSSRAEPKTPRDVHAVKAAAESRERTRYGWTHYHAGGRSRSDASRALPTGRSQGLVVAPSRALAGRKLASTA